MKKIILTSFLLNTMVAISLAQSPVPAAVKPPPATELTTEDKNGHTAKQEEHIQAAFKNADLTEEQIKSASDIIAEYGKKNKEVKDNEKLTAEEKAKFTQSNIVEQNTKLKELMGAEKFNLFSETKKQQHGAKKGKRPGQ